jgi:Domain of unknown function (DUF2703)
MQTINIAAALILGGCAVAHEEGSPAMKTPNGSGDRRHIEIDLLALDLDTCGRCTGTAANLDEALASAADALREADVDVQVRKHVVRTAADAERLRFVSSPTIRVDGRDIALELKESSCKDCGSLCGCGGGIDCRVWVWRGQEHTEAPKAMILDAVLRAAEEPDRLAPAPRGPYRMPENLRRFFEGAAAKAAAPIGTCCAPSASGTAEPAASCGCGR